MFTTPITLYNLLNSRDGQENRRAFEELGRMYAPFIYRFVVEKTHDEHLAEDIVQVVLVALLKAADRRSLIEHAQSGQFRSFLKKIANRTWNHLRRRESRLNLTFVENLEDLKVVFDDATDYCIAQLNHAKAILILLEKVVEDPRDRAIFRLKYIENRSTVEIAEKYSLSTSTIYAILKRVAVKIQEALSNDDTNEDG